MVEFCKLPARMKRLLLPFAWIYNLVTRFRNHLYNIGYRKSVRFEGVYTIGVGNLNMGGSGKTPVTEYLIRLLKDRYRLAILSRGYGRRTRGFRLLAANDEPVAGGDEPVQVLRKFKGQISVAVAEDRSLAIPSLMQQVDGTQVIVLDDIFQHRRVFPDLNILLTRYEQPFHSDLLFPAGWLREARIGARRADVVIFTKSPEVLRDEDIQRQTLAARRYAGDVPVFFCRHVYGEPVAFGSAQLSGKSVVLVTGIAQSDFLAKNLPHGLMTIRHFRYADHHIFTVEEVSEIQEFARSKGASILTTEKDMVRLLELPLLAQVASNPWFYLPVEIGFLHNGKEFDNLVVSKIARKLATG